VLKTAVKASAVSANVVSVLGFNLPILCVS